MILKVLSRNGEPLYAHIDNVTFHLPEPDTDMAHAMAHGLRLAGYKVLVLVERTSLEEV